jgi:hypothetical protein
MRKSWRPILNGVICLLLPQTLFFGCSLIGFAIGSASDANRDDIRVSFRDLPYGTPIVVITKGGGEVNGAYVGVVEKPPEAYRREYASALENRKVKNPIPLPGDSLIMIRADAPNVSFGCRFLGIDPGVLVLDINPRSPTARRPIETFLRITTGEGTKVHLPTLLDCIRSEFLPYRTEILLVAGPADTARIPFDSIVTIEKDEEGSGKWTGLIIGAVVDAFVIACATASVNESCAQSNQACKEQNRK